MNYSKRWVGWSGHYILTSSLIGWCHIQNDPGWWIWIAHIWTPSRWPHTQWHPNYQLIRYVIYLCIIFVFTSWTLEELDGCPNVREFILQCKAQFDLCRDHFVYTPSQWETTLQCNVVSHWLGACTDRWWSLVNEGNTTKANVYHVSVCTDAISVSWTEHYIN